MLKALELAGFKSFADRVRFEFPAGITVIVGPNGSGKSNIVDAIKWVLGEQSAKSLRGKDMADVIFKGSGQSGRKPASAAEATLVFDNADGRLAVDAPEVHITRRIYKSGEGEYLINRQPTRLKDIRDLLRGTGLGGDAYSLIEQGKVDRLLQASARDRRAMFEEAAGISRFKAKKIEAQRRLERVDQNLLRLTDIVEEVENRLKTVRNQAGKARRYREYTERLQALRTQIARADWQSLGERLAGLEADLAAVIQQIQTADAESQRLEAQQLEQETAAATAGEELRNCENQRAAARQQIAQHEASIAHERSRLAELVEELQLHGRNLLSMNDRAGDVRQRLRTTQAEVAAAQNQQSAAAETASRRDGQLAELARRYDAARQAAEAHRRQHVAQLQAAAALASQVEAVQANLAAIEQASGQHERQLSQLAAEEIAAAEELAAAEARAAALLERLAAHAQALEAAQNDLAENRNLHASRAEDLAQLQSRHRGVAERHDVLEEFERTLEGIGAGVKELLARAGIGAAEGSGFRVQGSGVRDQRTEDRGQRTGHGSSLTTHDSAFRIPHSAFPWSLIRGVVADFLQVNVEHAAAIDAALGDAAQAIVIDGDDNAAKQLVAAAGELGGRVAVLPLATGSLVPDTECTVPGSAGIVGRADAAIECPPHFLSLASLLLGRTWIVHSLAEALALRPSLPAGSRLVTLAGELVDELGAIHFGPRQSATSLISRRSQLRAARLNLAVLDQQVADASRETQHLKREIERHEQSLRQLAEAGKALDEQAAAERLIGQTLSQRLQQTRQQKLTAQAALTAAQAEAQSLAAALRQSRTDLDAARAASDTIHAAIASQEQDLVDLDRQRQSAAEEVTAAKVELARCQQRLESLRLRLSQFEDDQRERERAEGQVRQQLRQARDRQLAAELAMLAASAQIARLALVAQSLAGQLGECTVRRDVAIGRRSQAADQLATLRRRALALRDQEHERQLAAEQVRHERRTLADRLRDDYGIELADLTEEPTAEEAQERAAALEEIELLRRKINQLGAVNLDALDELDELEQRFGTLSAQHKDLTEAKQALERIIHKINADSRRLFLETLEAIRVNFQALYRKAFGGGKADIVLEEGVDVLECGVEIIATPPGKPSFNNSLLSGGEKALTAVALLLAIFQFRPSPFCVLDEVDAPFDEANIGRFIDVLKDFLGWTRFVIVTHSKKTMTAATTLYGVTMQESGVSKRVSVRFDDVSEDGHIRREALDRAATEEAGDQRGVA
jgi:chromosome segregation protein